MQRNPDQESRDNKNAESQNNPQAQGQPSEQQEASGGIQMPEMPTIELPKGGGAIAGMGEKFTANPATGTGSFSMPITLSPGRGDFTPPLSLAYNSGSGNSPYGFGWDLGLPTITRKTDQGIPRYNDAEESDTFVLSGSEDLVRKLEQSGSVWSLVERDETTHMVYSYRSRTEGMHAKIERWKNKSTGISHWEVTNRENVKTIYGKSAGCRVADPNDPKKVFSWLIEQSIDPKGNVVEYGYKSENTDGISTALVSEKNRLKQTAFPKQYLKTVKYGNTIMHSHASFSSTDWHFQLVLDYGEHDQVNAPTTAEVNTWAVRQDPFSHYRAGFEIRTWRLCNRILMFHKFQSEATLASSTDFVLVKSTDLTHNPAPNLTKVTSITHRSYETDGSSAAMPPVDFKYSEASMDSTLRHFETDDLENLPAGADGQKYIWSDLDGEGITGILTETESAWYYKRNYGDRSYYYDYPVASPPAPNIQFGAQETVATKPSPGNIQHLADVTGDGLVDVVIKTAQLSGYFERQQDGEWQRFQAFEQMPNINWDDPNLRMIDLDGDGLADVLITEDECFRWYANKGKTGYVEGQQHARFFEEEKGPALVFEDGTQSIYLTSMSGGGLTDICRIRNGEVCYWPNLGYGHFGEKVTMDQGAFFDYPDQFDQSRIRLVDLDGSGTTDVLYLGANKVSYWSNNSGNSLSLEKEILNFPKTDHTSAVQAIDLFGKGTSCLVWSSPLPGDEPSRIRYIDLMGKKPYLLNEVNNNLGTISRIHYAPSTKFYLRDRAAGNPWITKLPFPVQVVERSEVFDEVTETRFVERYAYHHGFYDRHEREFRGFGMVEKWDTEQYDAFSDDGLFQVGSNALNEDSHIPPIYTKTWFHNGSYLEANAIASQYKNEYFTGDSSAWLLDDMQLPAGLTAAEEREAARALKGQPLRSEVYADDNSALSHVPYTVSENGFRILVIQPRENEPHAVFQVVPTESLSFQNERTVGDSRISQNLTLETDAYGSVIRQATVAYQRRGGTTVPETATTYITYTENDVINQLTGSNGYFIGVPEETRVYDITGVNTASTNLTASSLDTIITSAATIDYSVAASSGYQKRLISKQRITYYDAACSAALSAGNIAAHGLPYRSQQLIYTAAMLAATNHTHITSSILTSEGNYVQDGSEYYASSPVPTYDPARFYQLIKQTDPFGNATTLTYDSHYIAAIKSTDPYGSVVTSTMDYRTLSPYLITDPNGNRQQVKYDALGMVVEQYVMGKTSETLGDASASPSVALTYDLFNWMNNGKPNYVHTRNRTTHGGSTWIESYAYSNGMGKVVLKKTQAEDGLAFERNGSNELVLDIDGNPNEVNCTNRWVGNGRTVLNNKGKEVKTYEPYFSCTHEYEAETEVREYGVSPITSYDSLGRPVRTDMPDGTFTKVEFTPWEQKTYDQNDTAKDSDWYIANGSPLATATEPTNPGERSAWLTLKHYDTPQLAYFDTLGRVFETRDDNNESGSTTPVNFYKVHKKLDVEGKLRTVTNAKNQQTTFVYSMRPLDKKGNGDVIYTDSPDNGWRKMISDAVGKAIRAWDQNDNGFRLTYDNLQRNTHSYVTEGVTTSQPEQLIGFSLYGDNAGLGSPENLNLIGQVVRAYDQSGVVQLREVDFKGNVLHTRKKLATNYKTTVNWSALGSLTTQTAVDAAALSLLETEQFDTIRAYDALNRPTSVKLPDATEVVPGYNKASLLEMMDVQMPHESGFTKYVTDIDYDAKGQRTDIFFGNGSKTRYIYDPKTYRLTRLITTRNAGADVLQDLSYTYDPIGNITEIEDRAQQGEYFSNHLVLPKGLYVYDSLYRLTHAQGREKLELAMPSSSGYTNEFLDLSTAVSATGFATYFEGYTYDELGNLQSLEHSLQDNALSAFEWTRNYQYTASLTNNYLLSTYTGATPPSSAQYTYDAHGNMTTMPHLSTISWDYKDQMKSTSNGTTTTYYVYSGDERIRKVTENSSNKRTNERIYLSDYELYRSYEADGTTLKNERKSVHLKDDKRRVAIMEVKTVDAGATVASPVTILRYQYTNHLDSANLELDHSANIISYEEYHPFGSTAFSMHSNNTEISEKRYRYVHKELDTETGLYYYGARYYAPWLCRFISVDPLKDKFPYYTSYQYAGNKPIGSIDKDGLESENKVEEKDTGQQTTATNAMTGESFNVPTQDELEALSDKDYKLWEDLLLWEKSDEYKEVFDEADKGRVLDKQAMAKAWSNKVNTDFYAVTIDKLPEGYTEETLLEFIRLNLADYTNAQNDFSAYDTKSEKLWKTDDFTGAVMHFDVSLSGDYPNLTNLDDLSVLATKDADNFWIFTPVGTALDFEHPLAGHRQFGLTKNENGTYTFYTRGIDLPWGPEDAAISGTIFSGADDLWNAVMDNVASFINENEGEAAKTHNFSRRIHWKKDIKDEHK